MGLIAIYLLIVFLFMLMGARFFFNLIFYLRETRDFSVLLYGGGVFFVVCLLLFGLLEGRFYLAFWILLLALGLSASIFLGKGGNFSVRWRAVVASSMAIPFLLIMIVIVYNLLSQIDWVFS